MRVIAEGQRNITKLLGKQLIKDTKYRKLKYLIFNKLDDGLLIHNVLTGMLVFLDKEEMLLFDSQTSICNEHTRTLIEHYFLVPIDYNERETVLKIRAILKRLDRDDSIYGYTILTTTNCNARCFYCYQNNYTHVNMTERVAQKLIEYMKKHNGKKALKLHWFGGEPLVCVDRIDQITESLTRSGIGFSSTMISNGYLFTESIVHRAKHRWNLRSVQITLDGTEDVYNATKAYVGAQDNPYHRVLDNIQLLLENKIRVLIRLNLDMHNIDVLNALIDEIYSRFGAPALLDVYVHLLFENEGVIPIKRDDGIRDKLFSYMVELNTRLEEMGLSNRMITLPALKTHYCMADRNGSVVVYPDGRLFKCEHILFEDVIGDLDSDIVDTKGIIKFSEVTELEGCSSCPLYPGCLLLKKCNGLEDYNQYTCKYRRESFVRSLRRYYLYKTNADIG